MTTLSNRNLILKAIINLLIAGITALPVLIFALIGKPTKRGFFCDDESLHHPFQESTVTDGDLYAYGFLVPLLFVLLVEVLGRERLPVDASLGPRKKPLPTFVINIYFMYVGFLLGAAMSQTITDICKYTIGRLRPHFFHVCNINLGNVNCTGLDHQPLYVTDYECPGNSLLFHSEKEIKSSLKDMRVSFLSGHASFSFQAAVFVMIYLQARGRFALPNQARSLFIIPFFQFLVIAVSVYIAITRVMNNMHHPSDVIAGAIVGTIAQILNCIFVQQLHCRGNNYESIPSNVLNRNCIETEIALEDSNIRRN